MNSPEAIAARIMTLRPFSFPRTLDTLNQLIDVGAAPLGVITQELARDPLLMAQILGQANTAAPAPVTRLSQATLSIGFGAVQHLLSNSRQVVDSQARSLAMLWASANATTCFLRTIVGYRATRLPKMPDEETLLALGMLHDLGTAIALIEFTTDYARASLRAKAGEGFFPALLKAELGVSPAELSAQLASVWGLPAMLAGPMQHHPAPMEAPEHLELTCLVHIARGLARAIGHCAPGDHWLDIIDERAVILLGLGRTDLERILVRASDEFDELDVFAQQLLRPARGTAMIKAIREPEPT